MSRWTKEREDIARTMFLDGYTATEIMKRLNCDLTRNAVIGKLSRLGLVREGSASRPVPRLGLKAKIDCARRAKAASVAAAGPRAPVIRSAPLPPEPPRLVGVPLVSVMALEAHHCRFPIGDPQSPGFGFCGHQRAPEKPYCVGHCAIAFTPAKSKRQSSGFEYLARVG